MPDKIRIGNHDYDFRTVPPWFTDWRVKIEDPDIMAEAEENEQINSRGARFLSCMLFITVALWVVAFVWLLVLLLP